MYKNGPKKFYRILSRYKWYLFISILLVLLVGRLFGFPVTISLIHGASMLPALEPGDLVVGFSEEYGIGDIVIWYGTIIHGVVHRVVDINNGMVTTKGDNNPFPDPPIPERLVRYKVRYIIEREYWITMLTVVAVIYLIIKRGELSRTLETLDIGMLDATYMVVTTLLVLNTALLVAVPIEFYSPLSVIPKPNIELTNIDYSNYRYIALTYTTSDLNILDVSQYQIQVKDSFFRGETYILEPVSIIYLNVPQEAYTYLYTVSGEIHSEYRILLNITLDKGWLTANYTIPVNWRKLNVTLFEDHLLIENPNPIQMNISLIKITYYDIDNKTLGYTIIDIETISDISITPQSRYMLDINPGWRMVRVYIEYPFKFVDGGVVYESRTLSKD